MNQFHLTELVQSPTCIMATTYSQLDMILTSIPTLIQVLYLVVLVITILLLHIFVLEESDLHQAIRLFILEGI